jgi:transcriptional regulator GlxA family with amidase domain
VLRLRLHRIRRDLASEEEAAHSVAIIANRWGVGELGRLAGRYRVAFGESPSETRLRTLATVA